MSEEKEPTTAADWFEEGKRCFQKPDGLGAVKAMERVTQIDPVYRHPDGDTPYFYLGKIHEVENRLEDAIFYYTRALAINAYDEESLIGRGSCYTVIKEHALAVADFFQVLQFPEEHRRAPKKQLLYAIAENYRQSKDWHNALKWGEQALAADPDNYRHQELVKEITAELNKNLV